MHLSPHEIGILIFFLGFGILSLWYLVLVLVKSPLVHLKGMFSYYSSTFGDAILIPISTILIATTYKEMSVTLNQALRARSKTVRNQTRSTIRSINNPFVTWIPYIISLLIVVLVHFSWLSDPTTELNWTIPSPHLINGPGIYHAFFFLIVICGS